MFSIVTVPSSTSTPTASARPPRLMMLMVWPDAQSPTAATSRERGIVTTTTSALRQSRRNSSTMKPGQQSAQRTFEGQAIDRTQDVGRLVELVADVHVVGQYRLELREVRLDEAHDLQRRRIGAPS